MSTRFFLLLALAIALPAFATPPSAAPAVPPAMPAVVDEPVPAPAPVRVTMVTSLGEIELELDPAAAPATVENFLSYARDGHYNGTVFHRAVPLGIVQGGDPISKDPAMSARYGTGGLHRLKREPNDRAHVRGAVSAVLVPNKPDSAGAQFFVCLTAQPGFDGQFTVFGEVVEGLEVVDRISQTPLDAGGRLTTRIPITKASVRDTPPASAARTSSSIR